MVQIIKPKEPINDDPISYLIDLIIRFSKILIKGRGLSRNGVKAFLLFLLTAGLLYGNTNMPTKIFEGIKLYWVPTIFIIYFLADLGRNIDRVNKFFKKLSQKTDYIYETIMDGTISHEDLGLYLRSLPFSYEQITDIINKLVDEEQFTSSAQNNLLHNNAIYRIDTFPLIEKSFIEPVFLKDSMVNIEWASSAVCVFLKKTSKNLSVKYLDIMVEKYNECPSILVAIGFFHHYRKDSEDNDTVTYFKMGYEFKNSKPWLNVVRHSFILTFIIFVIFSFTAITLFPSKAESLVFYQMGLGFLVLTMYLIHLHVKKNQFIWLITKHMKNYNIIKDDYVAGKITKDLYEATNIE